MNGPSRLRTLARWLRRLDGADDLIGPLDGASNRRDGIVCHIARCPRLKEDGFRMRKWTFGGDYGFEAAYQNWRHWLAVQHFFEISSDVAIYLFGARMYDMRPTSQKIAERIEEFLAGKNDIVGAASSLHLLRHDRTGRRIKRPNTTQPQE